MPSINKFYLVLGYFYGIVVLAFSAPYAGSAELRMQDIVTMAIKDDPWLAGNQLQEQSLRITSQGANSLPDPMLSLGMLNLPTDGFAFNQEPMTQLKVGVTQSFPRGDSLALRQRQLSYQADQYPFQRADRKAKIQVAVSTLWVDAIKAQMIINLIKDDRVLFEQLVEIVNASYSAAQGNTRQQDVISAQLELARLEDRLIEVKSQRDSALSQLTQWITSVDHQALSVALDKVVNLPTDPALDTQTLLAFERVQHSSLLALLTDHPAILAIEQSAKAGDTAVRLAKQQYKPQWGVNASYAYRDDNSLGQSRADFFSIGVTVEIPLWGYKKQDSGVAAMNLQAQAIETDKRLLQQQMLAKMLSLYQQILGLEQREEGYLAVILPQMQQQADASLSAYTHDDGDFSQVMRTRITQLNAHIDLIALQSKKQQTRLQLDYFLTPITDMQNRGAHP
jgi:outer membrane protein TolC